MLLRIKLLPDVDAVHASSTKEASNGLEKTNALGILELDFDNDQLV